MSAESDLELPADATTGSAERMRAEFDRSFAEPVRPAAEARDFVLVAAGGTQWALGLEGLEGIEHGRTLVPVPSSHPALLGLAGVRTVAVPVFDLAVLAGAGGTVGAGKAPVFALLEAAAGQRVGVAFERLLLFARVGVDAMLEPASLNAARPMLLHEEELYTMVAAKDLLRAILDPAGSTRMPARQSSFQAATSETATDLRNGTGYEDTTE